MNVSLWYNSSMNLIDGKALAAKMQAELKVKVDKLKEADNVPGLAVILVGEDPASQIYVRNKARQSHSNWFKF
jgi:methylenetetrahydrofolate dehydrogenase (NADP+) / methenyltetrahydrofolate cyclohydrolase